MRAKLIGMSAPAFAKDLVKSESAVRTMLSRALAELSDHLWSADRLFPEHLLDRYLANQVTAGTHRRKLLRMMELRVSRKRTR